MDDKQKNDDLYAQSHRGRHGKLRIYFGYAAGVGKTCAMLHDAWEAQKDGIDVVAGYIEPHARPETLALMEVLECLPSMEINYKGVSLREFDLDCALKRKPSLILVEELAHSNANGCRHKKRYQDVDELLRAGIDVYTTVNVQHIESLHDLVASITGISVRERIPDSVFNGADQIELVDIEPDDLIDRLVKGKIYREKQAQKALENFFTKQKLIALREIALRRTADQVTRAAIQNAAQNSSSKDACQPYGNEHILVCLSAAPSNTKVIRTAARMAGAFHGAFTALFVETPASKELDEKAVERLQDNLRLAEQLGAQIITVYGENIPEQIAEYVKASGITKIVMGRSAHIKRWFVKTNFVDKLTELAPNLDIYIIPDTQPSRQLHTAKARKAPKLSIADTVKSLTGLTACSLIGFWFQNVGFDEANIITVYILGVLLNSLLTSGWVYGLVYSVLSVLAFNYFFTEPSFTLRSYGTGYPITFAVMLAASLITSALIKRVKTQAQQSAEKAYRTEVLLETNQKLEQANTQTDILSETALQLVKLLNRTIIVYTVKDQKLEDHLIFESGAFSEEEYLNKQECAVAEWVYKNNKRAGASTNTLSAAKCLYLAIRSGNEVLAVAGVAMDQNPQMEPFEKNLMIAMLGECAMALEKQRADEVGRQVAVEAQQERLRANLLRAISHDLRTPLTSISGNAGVLLNNAVVLDEVQKAELYSDIYDDSIWLNNLAENLLAITRIENSSVSLNMRPELIADVMEEALAHISCKSVEHHIKTVVSDELLMARMDARLIVQVIVNMADNAIKYTQTGSNITVLAILDNAKVRVEVSDDGPGISDEAKTKLFDMFYTADNARGDGRRGLGLGLYLCKAIIGAHEGEIYVKDNIPKGSTFGFTLQAEEVQFHE